MKIKIKNKIIISFCLLVVLLLASQIVFNLFFSKQYYIHQNSVKVESLYEKIKKSYTDEQEVLYTLTENEDNIDGFSIRITSDSGVIYSSRNLHNDFFIKGDRVLNKKDDMNFENYKFNPTARIINVPMSKAEMLSLNGKFLYKGQMRYVSISQPIQSIQNSVNVLTVSSSIISIVVLILGIFVIIFLARDITKPIKNIEQVAKKLSELDFSYQADDDVSSTELSSLAQSVNSMSRQLESSIINLKLVNSKLQKDVDYQKEIDSMRKQFIANVSHEMKTPIALLQLYSENLKNDVAGIDKSEYYETIIEECLRLDKIVHDMLDISMIENGLAKMNFENFNLSTSCEKLVDKLSAFCESFNLDVKIQPNIYVLGDENQLNEAMRNYIMNAVSHTRHSGKILIKLEQIKSKVVFSVYNDGEKIYQSDTEKIWDSFYKSDKSRTRKSGTNAGLGLYIVKLIINSHGGSYSCENIDNGVEFKFELNL